MSDIEAFRQDAAIWLARAAPIYGRTARKGLGEHEALALGRRYQRSKFVAGYAGINWPEEFGGRGLSHLEKMVFDNEELKYGMPTGYFAISLGMPIPVLMRFCQDRDFVLKRTLAALRGDEIWCQLFSEPAGGSDLAGLRLKAEPDGDGWKLNGQKLWTSLAQYSEYGVIVARTDPTVPKHQGLTYFWVDMRAPGVTVRPIKLASGSHDVNEVFFEDVKLTDAQRMSPVGGGFGVAMATLMIERYVVTDSAGLGPHLDMLLSLARRTLVNGRPALEDGRIRQQIARAYALRNALDAITSRSMLLLQAGMEPGPEGSLQKLFAVRARQRLSEFAIDLQGPEGLALDHGAEPRESWQASWLDAPIGRIAGGADEMLLNTIAEKILGLPQDHRPDKGVPFNQIPNG